MTKSIETYSTIIYLHPAVVGWIRSSFPYTENGYDLRNEDIYFIIQTSLIRENLKKTKPPHNLQKKQKKFLPIKILIHEWDFYHFGWEIPTFAQIKISNFLFNLMMKSFCEHIAYAYAYAGISRDATIRRILVEFLFEDEEMNFFYIRKYYQRKFQNTGKEMEIIDFAEYTIKNLTQI
jgi:hypothetical protein